jgi:predicted nucleotidyltransferase
MIRRFPAFLISREGGYEKEARTLLKRGSPAMVKSSEEVLRLIEQNQAALKKLGVRRLGLFGSCARGEATAESDLDFVVEFSDKSFDAYMDLKSFLEDLFLSRVDLVTVSSIKPRLLPIIQRETVYASGF